MERATPTGGRSYAEVAGSLNSKVSVRQASKDDGEDKEYKESKDDSEER